MLSFYSNTLITRPSPHSPLGVFINLPQNQPPCCCSARLAHKILHPHSTTFTPFKTSQGCPNQRAPAQTLTLPHVTCTLHHASVITSPSNLPYPCSPPPPCRHVPAKWFGTVAPPDDADLRSSSSSFHLRSPGSHAHYQSPMLNKFEAPLSYNREMRRGSDRGFAQSSSVSASPMALHLLPLTSLPVLSAAASSFLLKSAHHVRSWEEHVDSSTSSGHTSKTTCMTR